jgi:DNA-binding NarL/FixJ family response regulator
MRRLGLVLLAGGVLGLTAEWVGLGWDDPRHWIPDLAVGWTFIGSGLIAWARRPASRTGPLMAATGFTWFLGNFAQVGVATAAWAAGHMVYLHRGPLVQLMLAYPSGRPGSRLTRGAVAVGYAQTIRAEHPQVGVLLLSQYVEPSYAMRLIQEHPERVGYLLKERVFDIATVVDALRQIVDGETVIDPTIVSRLVGRRRRADPLVELSERERQVLGLIAEGMSNRAIAARLFVTERTVEAHVTQVFQKLRLPESPDQHRRVLAVLAFLRA